MELPAALSGVKAKLERTEQNVVNLSGEIKAFIQPDIDSSMCDEKYDIVKELIDPHQRLQPPLRFSVLAGECIHNLRSCLDQLAWQLVITNSSEPGEQTSFPIYTFDPAADKEAFARYCRKIEGMSVTAKATIDRLQPYKPRNGGTRNPLAILHHLNIADKHHDLLIISPKSSYTENIPEAGKSTSSRPYIPFSVAQTEEDGAISICAQRGEPPMDVDRKVTLQISFADDTFSPNESVVESLWKLWNTVFAVVVSLTSEFH